MGVVWRNARPYFYASRRDGGRVVTEYLGSGALAELAAAYADAERVEAQRQRAAFWAQANEAKERASLLRHAEAALRDVVAGVLVATGHYQHKRQWRKRVMREPNHLPSTIAAPAAARNEKWMEGMKALRAALATVAPAVKPGGKRTKRDEAEAEQRRRQAVGAVIDAYPVIWTDLRHFLSSAEKQFLQNVTDDDVTSTMIQTVLRGIRRDLGYTEAPMLEQLLIEHIALAWFDLDLVQQRYARSTLGNHALSEGAYWSKRLNGAQARYLRATEALARIRRLASPIPLQVNIGGQQVNVAGTVPGERS